MNADEIFRNVDDTLLTARFGLEGLHGQDPRRRLAGLRNVVVFGRAVTNVLQNMRSVVTGFDQWYEPKKTEMRADPLLRRLYELRSEILKKGVMKTLGSMYIASLNLPQDLQRFGPPPPNASSFFIGDETGGTGWEVRRPDGSVEKYYVTLPADIGTFNLVLPDPPREHLGQSLASATIEHVSELYITYLERLIDEAKKTFLGV